jgi:hypothetical protein
MSGKQFASCLVSGERIAGPVALGVLLPGGYRNGFPYAEVPAHAEVQNPVRKRKIIWAGLG